MGSGSTNACIVAKYNTVHGMKNNIERELCGCMITVSLRPSPLPLITPADGKYWIFTFAYSVLDSLTIWINMNQRALPISLSSAPRLIHLLIQLLLTSSPLCSEKVSIQQSVTGEAPLPAHPVMHKQGSAHSGPRFYLFLTAVNVLLLCTPSIQSFQMTF